MQPAMMVLVLIALDVTSFTLPVITNRFVAQSGLDGSIVPLVDLLGRFASLAERCSIRLGTGGAVPLGTALCCLS